MPTNATIDDRPPRRRWRRYHLGTPVRVKVERLQQAALVDAHACQMNDGGLAIYADAELSTGAQLQIEFPPATFDLPLSLRGVIRNRVGSQYGVEFLVTSAEEKEHLILFQQILRNKVGCLDA